MYRWWADAIRRQYVSVLQQIDRIVAPHAIEPGPHDVTAGIGGIAGGRWSVGSLLLQLLLLDLLLLQMMQLLLLLLLILLLLEVLLLLLWLH